MEAEAFVNDVPQMGGKKRQNKRSNKKGGAVDVGTVVGPAVLYTLRRLATPGGKRKQRGGDAFSSQAAPVGESTGPLMAFPVAVAPAGSAVVPPSGDMVPKEAVAISTDSGDKSLGGGAKKGKKGKKVPMAEGRLYGKVKLWGGAGEDTDIVVMEDTATEVVVDQEGGKKKRKGGDKKDKKNDNNDNNQDGGKKKNNKRKGGDKKDNDNNQDGGKKKRNSKKNLKGGALDLYAQQLQQISESLNKLMF